LTISSAILFKGAITSAIQSAMDGTIDTIKPKTLGGAVMGECVKQATKIN